MTKAKNNQGLTSQIHVNYNIVNNTHVDGCPRHAELDKWDTSITKIKKETILN